jgi:hypothetical protein
MTLTLPTITALLEQGINSLGVWYRYDDGDGAVNFSFSAGDAIGSGFTPAFFPISVDTVAVNLNTAGNCNVKLYQLDGAGGAPNTQLWSTTSTLVSGWNYFVTGGVDVFEDGFAVVVEPNADITIVMDDEAPIAATNMDMPVVAWVNQAGWQNWGSGDLLLRGYITESSAIPPFPVLDLSADTIYFDSTAVGDTATYALWMYNIGGLDPLIINNIVLNPTNPPNIFTRISGTLPITIQAGDSCEVDFRFVPPSVGNFLTVMGIQNNATPPMVLVPIYGTGTEPAFVYGDQRPLPTYYSLGQNQPNPFNPSTTINFTLPQAGKVELAVYNVLGAKILTLVNGDLNAGYHLVKFDATKLCSGIYFYRLTAGNFTDMKKMVLMK